MGERSAAPRRQGARSGQRAAALAQANRRRAAIAALKAEARSGRLGLAALLSDPRARGVRVLTLLPTLRRLTLEAALEALLLCRINGARTCGDLSEAERRALANAVAEVGHGAGALRRRALPEHLLARDAELDRALAATHSRAVAVELRPAEFAAARSGLEADPLLLRMLDRLIDALRLYADRDDGGRRAQVVLEQWIRYRNYLTKVARGELAAPSVRGPAELE